MYVRQNEIKILPKYQGFAPIATCHFQNLANILEDQGILDAQRVICQSWGFTWKGNGVLYGGENWINNFNKIFQTKVGYYSFVDWETSLSFEKDLLLKNIPYVVEVDAYELPSPYYQKEHVIHTVTVLENNNGWFLLDSTNNPNPAFYDNEQYRRMRSNPCDGRLQAFALYVSLPKNALDAPTSDMVNSMYCNILNCWDDNLKMFDDYISWVSDTNEQINVCRVAAEREYLRLLFQKLSEDYSYFEEFEMHFQELSEKWYLLHMITLNEFAVRTNQRPRIVRLLLELRERENLLSKKFVSVAKSSLIKNGVIGT